MKPQQHRVPTKATPFSTPAGGSDSHANQSSSQNRSRSYLQRSSTAISLRKAKRCQTVASKRHMHLPTPLFSTNSTENSSGNENPYRKDTIYVNETINVAESVVSVCSGSVHNVEQLTSLRPLLERLCILVTPSENDPGCIVGNSSGARLENISNRGTPIAASSYDSSLAGIAANALLSVSMSRHGQQHPHENLAFLLANSLAAILQSTNPNNPSFLNSSNSSGGLQIAETVKAVQIQASVALTQLAATDPAPPPLSSLNNDHSSPISSESVPLSTGTSNSSTPTSWCYVIVHSDALLALVQTVATPTVDLDICEKCVWAIGNLAGDSEMAREALLRNGILPRLNHCIAAASNAAWDNAACNSIQSVINLVRNAVWGMTNIVRERKEIINKVLAMSGGDGGLTQKDFAILLSAPENMPPVNSMITNGNNPSSSVTSTSTWYDVALEACWLLVFMTSNDDLAVKFLCCDGDHFTSSYFLSMLATRLIYCTDVATRTFGVPHNRFSEESKLTENEIESSLLCLIPCCRVIRNVALSEYGRGYVTSILATEARSITHNSSIVTTESCIVKLIEIGTLGAGKDATSIAVEAVATAGACLLRAGFPTPRHCTNTYRTLIPALCQALVCPLSTFELQREVVWALCCAVDIPETNNVAGEAMGDGITIEGVQADILFEILRTKPFLALSKMVSSVDSGMVEASLRLVDILLRRLNSSDRVSTGGKPLTVLFEEAGLVDALNHVCENDLEESYAAELAANLLDDFFEAEEEDEEEETMISTEVVNGHFQFQVPSAGVQSFNFGNNPLIQQSQAVPASLPGRGRGRGRGQVIPAWMQQQQQQQPRGQPT